MQLQIMRFDPELPPPSRAQPGDAGLDLRARESTLLPRGGARATIPTGIGVAIPAGFVGLVLPRSGLAARHGVTVLNAPGIIDSGYRGELAVILINLDYGADYRIERGDRIAQLVLVSIPGLVPNEVDSLPESPRGGEGLGHSGR